MKILFNDSWQFAELGIDETSMFKEGPSGKEPVLFSPDQFFDLADKQSYKPVNVPHDWQIYHVKDLYRNSIGFYIKQFTLSENDCTGRYIALNFEGVYMNSAVWVNGKKAGEWVEFGGLLGGCPVMDVNTFSCADFINRGGRIPAPIHSFRN